MRVEANRPTRTQKGGADGEASCPPVAAIPLRALRPPLLRTDHRMTCSGASQVMPEDEDYPRTRAPADWAGQQRGSSVSGEHVRPRPGWNPVDGCRRPDGISTFLVGTGSSAAIWGQSTALSPDVQSVQPQTGQSRPWAAPQPAYDDRDELPAGSGVWLRVPRLILV